MRRLKGLLSKIPSQQLSRKSPSVADSVHKAGVLIMHKQANVSAFLSCLFLEELSWTRRTFFPALFTISPLCIFITRLFALSCIFMSLAVHCEEHPVLLLCNLPAPCMKGTRLSRVQQAIDFHSNPKSYWAENALCLINCSFRRNIAENRDPPICWRTGLCSSFMKARRKISKKLHTRQKREECAVASDKSGCSGRACTACSLSKPPTFTFTTRQSQTGLQHLTDFLQALLAFFYYSHSNCQDEIRYRFLFSETLAEQDVLSGLKKKRRKKKQDMLRPCTASVSRFIPVCVRNNCSTYTSLSFQEFYQLRFIFSTSLLTGLDRFSNTLTIALNPLLLCQSLPN